MTAHYAERGTGSHTRNRHTSHFCINTGIYVEAKGHKVMLAAGTHNMLCVLIDKGI